MGGPAGASSAAEAPSTSAGGKRERHTKTDYSYVRTDLVTVAAVATVTMAFVLVMAFII